MEKFNSMELNVFNLIRSGKSRNEILTANITTPANLSVILSGIYKKTDEYVKYHSERNKFEELAGYLRNNPEAFGPIPAGEFGKIAAENKKAAKSKPEPKEEPQPATVPVEKIVKAAFDKVGGRIQNELNISSAKAQTVNELYTEIIKGGVCL